MIHHDRTPLPIYKALYKMTGKPIKSSYINDVIIYGKSFSSSPGVNRGLILAN